MADQDRKIPRLLWRVLVCVFIGLLINATVAVGFWKWSPVGTEPIDLDDSLVDGPVLLERTGVRVYWPNTYVTPSMEPTPNVDEYAVGWPMLAFGGDSIRTLTVDGWQEEWRGFVFEQFSVRRVGGTGTWPPGVPLRPIWSGLAVNTLLFALVALCICEGLVLLRRSGRSRRGLCPLCAYDLKRDFDAGCSECGWGRAEPGEGEGS